jgi:NAD(P)-dependent dehydrogenase (short-subunit alcohol dehydrogenase family)
MTPFDLSGKNILVTGASSGLGRQIAISCSRMGARIVLMARDGQRLQKTLSEMQNPEYHLSISVDLVEFEKIETSINEAVAQIGKIHGLVNCAGISSTLPIRSVSPEKLLTLFNINVISAYQLTRLISNPKYFSHIGGSIIFISSVMGLVGENGKSAYSMTKGALISGARSLAVEFSSKKIRVNCISPGIIITPLNANAEYISDENKRQALEHQHLLGLGTPEDVASACIYLLSNASRWVTGINLVVDGGYTVK